MIPMKTSLMVMIALTAMVLVVSPAAAFETTSLDISVGQSGGAVVTLGYHLTPLEMTAVYLHLIEPSTELAAALSAFSSRGVEVRSVSVDQAVVNLDTYAETSVEGQGISYATPRLDFARADAYLQNTWFAGFIYPDISPSITTTRFPDGFVETAADQPVIPSYSHTVPVV
ncbi:hypothetical protein [Methanosphaerula subterraneus]|uniref:hypothetical protein n=1 Tax=Methanosphaerula subterraneus TaxID=3350244 RepID=UPI003F87E813